MPEPRLGLAPGGGGTQRLPRIVGKSRALEVLLTGRNLTGQDAFDWGIANKVVPKEDLLAAAEDLARAMIALAPGALATIKRRLAKAQERVHAMLARDPVLARYIDEASKGGFAS